PNSKDIREEIEKALNKLNKSEVVKEIYKIILNDIDNEVISAEEDVLIVKRLYFTEAYNKYIKDFSIEWCVSEDELQTSAIQYETGMKQIPNIKGISDSRRFEEYKAVHPEAIPLSYFPKMRRAWGDMLDEIIMPLNEELR